jgi:uroporphyrinogen-III synthase
MDDLGVGQGEDFGLILLNRMATRMSAPAAQHQVLHDVVEFVMTVVRCDSCMVYVREGENLVLRASTTSRPGMVGRLSIQLGQRITGWGAPHQGPTVVARGAFDNPCFQFFNELSADRFEAFLSVPLASGGRFVGVINVQNRAAYLYSKREIGMIATLGFLVGAEVEKARLESENLDLSLRLEARKLIERAKGILQRDWKVGRDDAHLTLQRESQQRGKSMREVAEAVILSQDLMRKR